MPHGRWASGVNVKSGITSLAMKFFLERWSTNTKLGCSQSEWGIGGCQDPSFSRASFGWQNLICSRGDGTLIVLVVLTE